MPFTLGIIWGILCTDVLQSLEYQVRPYEIVTGETDRVVRESVDYLCDVFRKRPNRGKKWGRAGMALHLAALRQRAAGGAPPVRLRSRSIGCASSRSSRSLASSTCRPSREIRTTTSTAGWNRRAREVYPAAIAVWLDYWMRWYVQGFEDRHRHRPLRAREDAGGQSSAAGLPTGPTTGCALRSGNMPARTARPVRAARLAAPYFHSRLSGGEGDMLVGKALWAHLNKKAHMICELSPYACMPNTMSIGAMAGVDRQASRSAVRADRNQGRRRGPCAFALPDDSDGGEEARASGNTWRSWSEPGLTIERRQDMLDVTPEMKRATYRVPHDGAVGTAANLLLHLARAQASGGPRENCRHGCRVHDRQGGSRSRTTARPVARLPASWHETGGEGARVSRPDRRQSAASRRDGIGFSLPAPAPA